MHRIVSVGRSAALAVILALALGSAALGDELRLGGRAEATGTVCPAAAGDASLDAFLGLGSVEAEARTEFSLFPYTTGTQALAVHVVREWLSVGAEYRFSVLPLGITSATITSSVFPPPWEIAMGDTTLEVSMDGTARLVGYTFATAPLRAEVWARASVGASRSLGWLDQVLLKASLEATLSAPGEAEIWPIGAAIAELSLGHFCLRSETRIPLAPTLRLEEERLSLRSTWADLGLAAEVELVLTAGPAPVTLAFHASYDFGDAPLRPTPSDTGCTGGVCRSSPRE